MKYPNRFPHVTARTRRELARRFPRDWDVAESPYRDENLVGRVRAREFPEWDAVHFEKRGDLLAGNSSVLPIVPAIRPETGYAGSWEGWW